MITSIANKAGLLTTPRNGGEPEHAAAKRPDAARMQRDSYYAKEAEPVGRTDDHRPVSDRAHLVRAAAKVEEGLKSAGMHVRLLVDEETDRVVVKVMKESGEVIRQFPPEEVLELAKHLSQGHTTDPGKGMLLEEEV